MVQITSRPVKVRRLEPFALCALSIHNGCDQRLMRILKPQVYYLNDWIVVEGHEGDETASLHKWMSNHYGVFPFKVLQGKLIVQYKLIAIRQNLFSIMDS